ncbi:hypothetical protein Rhopal_005929-T1 [Rhodotorula paludigena]|uniref:F-box domain-containing protein n=1 Tax=Rhodotorula paludigena TaxID=86838 RepID=A0AAV5GQT8_9BASI|nr:hypothetical protein Rhopal_005929-T1 [Rhodotorula paludigena]
MAPLDLPRAPRWPPSVAVPANYPLAPRWPPALFASEGAHKSPAAPVARKVALEGRIRRDLFSSLPLEVLQNILSYAEPVSLLALSRTSSSFRAFLLSRRTAAALWAQARTNAQLRDLAAGDLSEPQVAYLVGGWECQLCGKDVDEKSVDFYVRVRCCAACLAKELKTVEALHDDYFYLHPKTFDCAFRSPDLYYAPDVLAVSACLYYLEAQHRAQDRDPKDAINNYVAARHTLRMQVRRDAGMLQQYHKDVEARREKEAAEKLRKRRRAYEDKLEQLGLDFYPYSEIWKRLADDLHESSADDETRSEADARGKRNREIEDFVESSDPYDDDDWEIVRERVMAWAAQERRIWLHEEMQEHREDLQDELYKSKFWQRIAAFIDPSLHDLLPPFDSFLRLPSIQPHWRDHPDGSSRHAWDQCRVALAFGIADMVEAVRNDKLRLFDRIARILLAEDDPLDPYLVAILSAHASPFVDADQRKGVRASFAQLTTEDLDSVLSRATALFRCGICRAVHSYPSIVAHVHKTQRTRAVPRCVPLEPALRGVIRQMLVKAGMPASTSCAALEQLGMVFETTGTNKWGTFKMKGRTWKELVDTSFHGVETLKLGRKLRRASVEGPGAVYAAADAELPQHSKARILPSVYGLAGVEVLQPCGAPQ